MLLLTENVINFNKISIVFTVQVKPIWELGIVGSQNPSGILCLRREPTQYRIAHKIDSS